MTNLRALLPRLIGSMAVCAVLVGISVQMIDRPVSTWIHEHLGDARFAWFTMSYDGHPLAIGPFTFMASPAQALRSLAVLALIILVVVAATGWRSKMRDRIVLTICVSIFAIQEINIGTKAIFGRTWPESWLGENPSWIRDGVYGFFPFHGGPGWGSFPSGHTAVITTPATLLWIVWPELRIVWAAIVAVVIAGLIGANYHFVSDTIGGIYLGAIVGLGMAGLMLSPGDRLDWSVLRGLPLRSEPASPTIDASQSPPEQA